MKKIKKSSSKKKVAPAKKQATRKKTVPVRKAASSKHSKKAIPAAAVSKKAKGKSSRSAYKDVDAEPMADDKDWGEVEEVEEMGPLDDDFKGFGDDFFADTDEDDDDETF